MRLAIISSLYHPHFVGGAERSAQRIAEEFARNPANQVMVITLGKNGDLPTERLNGVTIVRISLKNIYWPFPSVNRAKIAKLAWHVIDTQNVAAASAVKRVLEAFQPDLVQTHNLAGFSTSVWASIAALKTPILHIMHDYYLLCPRSTMVHGGVSHNGPHGFCQIARSLQQRQTRLVSAVVGVSEFTLETHVNAGLFPRAKVREVIWNGYQRPSSCAQSRVPRESAGRLKIGFLGQITEVKGLHVLLAAMKSLPSDRVELQIAGEGRPSYVSRLKEEFPLSNIKFLGKVPAADLLDRIDVLCVPSVWNDPLPTVVFEAYAHGVTVVGSRAGGITEMIEDRNTGILFPMNDVAALSQALRCLLDNPSRLAEMRSKALGKSGEFSVSKNISAYTRLHEKLLSTHSSRGLELARQ